MDISNLIVAGLALIGTLAGSFMAQSKTTALLSYRIEKLEEKVNKHNQIVERTYKLEKDVTTAFLKLDDVRSDVTEIKKDIDEYKK